MLISFVFIYYRPCIYLLFTTLILCTHRKSIILPSIRALYFRSTILHYLRKVLLLFLNIKMRMQCLQCKNIQYVFVKTYRRALNRARITRRLIGSRQDTDQRWVEKNREVEDAATSLEPRNQVYRE